MNQKESLPAEKLERVSASLDAKNFEMLRFVFREGPHVPIFAAESQNEELQRLMAQHDELLNSKEYKALVEHLEQAANHLEKSDAPAAQQRIKLLVEVLDEVGSRIRKHNQECAALADKTTDIVSGSLGLPGKLKETVTRSVLVGPPASAPEGAGAELSKESDALAAEWEAMMGATAEQLGVAQPQEQARRELRQRWEEYEKRVSVYEQKCVVAGRDSFIRVIGMPDDISEEEFASFEKDLLAPLPAVNAGGKSFPSDVQQKLLKERSRLEYSRTELERKLPTMYRHGVPDSEKKNWNEEITSFLLLRSGYEKEVMGQSPNMDKWMMYAGVVGMEIAEEGFESFGKINGQSALLKMPLLRDLNLATRTKVLNAWQSINGKLAAKGVPMQKLGAVLSTMNKTPLGPQFWGKLLEVESAVTVLLWGLHMHTSENKLKACMQFGSFMAVSKASNAVMSLADAALVRLGIASKIPGNPAVKFAAALAIAFLSQEQVDAFTTWIDESIPDGPAKHKAGVALGLAFGEPIFAMAGAISETTGLSGTFDKWGISGFDPERDLMSYLGEEGITIDETGVADMRFLHTNLADWNQRLEQALPSQKNKILRSMYESQRIDYNSWPQRRAVILYTQYGKVTGIENSLSATLRDRGILSGGEKISASDVAVADTGDARNDRQTAYFIESDPACDKAENFIATLPEGDALKAQWKEYVTDVRQMAKDVSIYRHYGLYNRSKWLGGLPASGVLSEADLPAFVENGLIEEIAFRSRRKQMTMPGAHPELSEGEFSNELGEAVRYKDAMSLPAQLMVGISQAIANAKQNYGRPVTGVEQSDPVEGDYVNLRNAIDRAVKVLPPRELDAALQPVRALILGGKTASHEELRQAVNTLLNAIVSGEKRNVPLQAPTAEELRKLGSKNVPCFIRGSFWQTGDLVGPGGEKRSDMKWDPFQQAFGGFLDRTQADLVVIESDTSGNAMRALEFHCGGGDRTKWFIESNAYSTSREGSFQRGVDRYDTQKIPFIDWQKANPVAALQIEPECKKLQEQGKKHDARLKADEEQLQREKNAELSERDRLLLQTKAQPGVWFDYPTRFVDIKKGEVPYQYVSYSAAADNGKGAYLFLQAPSYFDPNVPAVSNNDPHDRQVLGKPNDTRVGIMREGETDIRREEVTMKSLPSLESGDVRAAWMHDAVLSPIPGRPRDAVAKVISLCRPVSEQLGRNLLDSLASMCPPNDADAQRQFLFELYRQMPRTDVLYFPEMTRINRIMSAYSWTGIDGALKREAGNAVMNEVNPFDEKDHYTKQYGWVGNKWLRAKFDGANGWRVGLGSLDDATHDPAGYSVDMWGGTDSYNALIGKLAEANGKSLYPAAKQAMAKKGTWVMDRVRGDELGGKIEYVAASDGRVFAQTTDGTRTWIHDFMSGAGIEQHGTYFSGLTGVLKPIPDTNTHHYDRNLHEWVPNDYNKEKIYWDRLYPVAKLAVDSYGTWIKDDVRQDQFKGKIEYICWPDNKTGKIYSQTTDGLDCRIHDPKTNRGDIQAGKYFDGVDHVLKDIPDQSTHEYDVARRTWVPKTVNPAYIAKGANIE